MIFTIINLAEPDNKAIFNRQHLTKSLLSVLDHWLLNVAITWLQLKQRNIVVKIFSTKFWVNNYLVFNKKKN